MTDRQLKMLRSRIEKSGFKMSYVINRLDLSREGFRKKMQGRSPFRDRDIKKLIEILGLTDKEVEEIFKDDRQAKNFA